MTKTTAEKIAVMQAYERGEKIELRGIGAAGGWEYAPNPSWNWLYTDYRIAAHDPIPHTIDWSHVEQSLVYLYTDANKTPRLSDRMPYKTENGYWLRGDCIVTVEAKLFTSFKPGNMPWQESLVVRPVYAKK